nr:hypothetical protein B0A51_10437 [Rachicladosporium sp. CCFEE 5018]
MPPLVRRRPLLERIKANLDLGDIWLWISEELNDDTYDELLKEWATPIGIALNIVFVIARGASSPSVSRGSEDVFGNSESRRGSGWFTWLASFLVYSLTLICCANAFWTFFRKRHYRLFEQPVDLPPSTPSAHRVRVDSSPASSSPIQHLQTVIAAARAGAQVYPDPEREVWEVSVWDPKPFNLTVFTLFSPGHLLVYFSLLPTAEFDQRPSLTVLMAILFGTVLSLQLGFLRTSFSQQAKDSVLIHGEVMNEYDTKFVHPFLNRPVRDVGIQTRESALSPRGTRTREVDIYTPTTIVKRGFKTNPNTNYASSYDPDDLANKPEPRPKEAVRTTSTPSIFKSPAPAVYVNGYTQSPAAAASARDYSSPIKPHHERLRERSPVKGDGGSFGLYSHAASPLRKATSTSQIRAERAGSPLKRASGVGGVNGAGEERRRVTGSIFSSLLQSTSHRSTALPPPFLLPAFAQNTPFSTTSPVSSKPTKKWNNSTRGMSAIKRSGLNKRIKLSVDLVKLPRPVLDPSLRSTVEVDPNHGLYGFFNSTRDALMTPEQLHAHGRGWTVQELRVKSWDDLWRLWWVSSLEVNRIKTYEQERARVRAGYGAYEAEGRLKEVRLTQKAVRHVLTERWYAWEAARVAAVEDPEVDLFPPSGGKGFVPGRGAEEEVKAEKLPFQEALGSYQPGAGGGQQPTAP